MELMKIVNAKATPVLLAAFNDIAESRTQFQLDKFVVKQHDTEEMRYKQVLLELQSLYFGIRVMEIEMKKKKVQLEKLRGTGDEIDELDAQILEIGLERDTLAGNGALREFDNLIAIYDSFEHKFTREEIEEGQAEYWNRRLSRQATLEAIGGSQAQASHLDALRQIGAIEMSPDGGIREVTSVEDSAGKKELQ